MSHAPPSLAHGTGVFAGGSDAHAATSASSATGARDVRGLGFIMGASLRVKDMDRTDESGRPFARSVKRHSSSAAPSRSLVAARRVTAAASDAYAAMAVDDPVRCRSQSATIGAGPPAVIDASW